MAEEFEVGDRVWVEVTAVEAYRGALVRPIEKTYQKATVVGRNPCNCGCEKRYGALGMYRLRVDRSRWFHLWRPFRVADGSYIKRMTVLEALADAGGTTWKQTILSKFRRLT